VHDLRSAVLPEDVRIDSGAFDIIVLWFP